MTKNNILFISSILIAILSIVTVMVFGNPENKTNFTSIAEISEDLLYSISRTAKYITKKTDREEIEIGNKIHDRLLKNKIAKNIEGTLIQKYVNDVGELLSQDVKRKTIHTSFI
jgi:uncharacterized membrane protein